MSDPREAPGAASTRRIADAALVEFAVQRGAAAPGSVELEPLAAGMSSVAWIGVVAGAEVVVRVPIGDGKRPTPKYAREARLLSSLAARSAPVAVPTIVRIGDVDCSVASRLDGRPIEPADWDDRLVAQFAEVLDVVHATSPELAVETDLVERFDLARIWPFDGTDLDDHPVATVWPSAIGSIAERRDDIERAADGAHTVVHTDLHHQHLLVGPDGVLTGLLDFGDAFAGVAAWDHACLRYYHGATLQRRVATAQRDRHATTPSTGDVELLGVAWALYKLAKTPARLDVRARVAALLRAARIDLPAD